MASPIQVTVVLDDRDRREAVADALAECDGITLAANGGEAPPDDVSTADAAVTDTPGMALPEDVPTVAFSERPPDTLPDTEGYVRATGAEHDYDRLADQLRHLANGTDSTASETDGDPTASEAENDASAQTAGDTRNREVTASDADDRSAKIERLHESTAEVVAARDEDELFELTVDAAENVLAFDVCYLLVRDGDRFVPAASSSAETDTGLQPVDLDHGLTGHTYETGESYLVDDIAEDPHADAVHGEYASGISIPVGDWAVFQATAKEHGAFDRSDLDLAELLLSYVNETYRRIGVERELRERRLEIEHLHESTAEVVAARDEDELFELTVDAAENVVGLEVCVIAIADEERDGDGDGAETDDEDGSHLVVEATSDSEHAPDPGIEVDPEMGVIGRTYRHGESILVEDAESDDRAEPQAEAFQSAVSVPLGDAGVLQAIATERAAYDEEDLRMAELLASHVGEALNRIRAEKRLRERESTLEEERDRMAALFENVPDPVAAFEFDDSQPIVRDVNAPFEETFGWSAEELRGENIDEYIVPPEDEPRADDLNEKLLSGERLRTTGKRLTADGPRDFMLHVVPHDVGERNVEGFAIYTDITEQKRRERELERQNERLDEFASIVSHDLRNPLGVAQGRIELARETDDDTHLESAEDALDRMERLIDELLTLARHGDVVGGRETVDLESVARTAWRQVTTGDAVLEVPGAPTVSADRERFCELLENLFRNAMDHAVPSDADPGTLTVEVGEWERDGERGFYVADDGSGIPPDQRDRIFDHGYTTGEGGTGFGLTVVKRIAEAHGWTVSVGESDAGGARFEFTVEGAQTPFEGGISGRENSP